MKKFFTIFLILFLILFTAIIKNSSKTIEDETFLVEENIRGLKKELERTKLEYDYLSSAEKLLEYQILYFDDELVKKNIEEIKIINKNSDNLEIEPFKISNE